MRLLCELVIVGVLIYIGWEKPFRQWLPNSQPRRHQLRPSQPPRDPPLPTQPAWMHDPNHRTPLDTPHPAAAPGKHGQARIVDVRFEPSLATRPAGTRFTLSALTRAKFRSKNPRVNYREVAALCCPIVVLLSRLLDGFNSSTEAMTTSGGNVANTAARETLKDQMGTDLSRSEARIFRLIFCVSM